MHNHYLSWWGHMVNVMMAVSMVSVSMVSVVKMVVNMMMTMMMMMAVVVTYVVSYVSSMSSMFSLMMLALGFKLHHTYTHSSWITYYTLYDVFTHLQVDCPSNVTMQCSIYCLVVETFLLSF